MSIKPKFESIKLINACCDINGQTELHERVLFKVLSLLVWVYAGLKDYIERKRIKFYTTYVNIEVILCLVFEKIVFISEKM